MCKIRPFSMISFMFHWVKQMALENKKKYFKIQIAENYVPKKLVSKNCHKDKIV